MSLDTLKLEALKLEKSDLFDFVQFIIETIKQKDSEKGFQLNEAQKKEIEARLEEYRNNPSIALSGLEAEQEIFKKHGIKL